MELKVVNALSRDVEREQLNKILKYISDTLASVNSGGITEAQVRTLIAESLPATPSQRPTTITLTGDATGEGIGTTSITIPVDLTGNFIEDAPSDSLPYWRQDGQWSMVPFPLLSLAYISPSGFASYNEDELEWNSRALTGTTGNITVSDGDGVAGNPVINLAPVPDGGVAPTLFKITRDTFGRVTNTQAATAADVPIDKLGAATWDNVQEFINVMNSPGLVEGGGFTDAGSGNLSYTSMRIAIRPTDSDTATLYMADIPAGVINIPNDSATRFVGVQYNAGVPNVLIKTTDTWNYDTEFPLGEVANLGGTLFPLFNPFKIGDPITNIIQRFDAQAYAIRSASGGLELSTSGVARTLSMTAGQIWTRLNDHPIAARTSITQPLYRVTPTGGTPPLSFTSGVNAWPNDQYLSGTTLTTMTNNHWAVLWIFVNIGTGAWGFAHGTAEYNQAAGASVEQVPAYLTSNFLRQNILVGRMIFEKGASTAIIESAFTRVFSTQAVSNHNQLSGLQGGALNDYQHLTTAQLSRIAPAGGTTSTFLRGDNVWSNELTGGLNFNAPVVPLTFQITQLAFSNMPMGQWDVYGTHDGSAYSAAITITPRAAGAWTSTEKPTLIQFRTIRLGTAALSEHCRFGASGEIAPGSDNSQDIGRPDRRWGVVYAGTGTINTSDAREKTTVRQFTTEELEAAAALGKEIGAYKWIAMIEEKGTSAREHIGMTVQRCIEIMELYGLDAFNYGFICYDEWEELEEILGEDGEVAQEARPAGNRYSFRMDELLAFIARGITYRLKSIEDRLDNAGL